MILPTGEDKVTWPQLTVKNKVLQDLLKLQSQEPLRPKREKSMMTLQTGEDKEILPQLIARNKEHQDSLRSQVNHLETWNQSKWQTHM